MSVDDDRPEEDPPAGLEAWIDSFSMLSSLLDDFLPDDVVLDNSAESLHVFEQVVATGAYPDFDPHIDDALAAYLGQTLRRAAGGRWSWDEDRHRPLLHADVVLGLPPVSPVDLIYKADGTIFIALYETWEHAARAYAGAHPDWEPLAEYTPGLDIVPPAASDADRLERWLAEQERAFPDWISRFGGTDVWDFSPDSFDTLAKTIFRMIPSEEKFADPQYAALVNGATWYCGEMLRRSASSRWEYQTYFEEYAVVRDSDDWPVMPSAHLSGVLRDGHPLEFCDHLADWINADPPGAPGEWTWTGTDWQDATDVWTASIAGRIRSLLPVTIPAEIELDTSVESLRRLEQIVLDRADDEALDNAVAAYFGETLLRTAGGHWRVNCEPIVSSQLGIADVPVSGLIRLARKWRDGITFTRVYEAWQKALRERQSTTPAWLPTKPPTPGLDPAPPPTELDTWAAQRQQAFQLWIAEYGPGRIWDFSYESLQELGAIVLARTPSRDELLRPDNNVFTSGATWYYGETLRRRKPARWDYHPCTHGEYDTPLRGFVILKVDGEDYHPLGVYPMQDLELMLDRSDPDALSRCYGNWSVAGRAARAKNAFARRGRKKSRRKQPDDQYLAQWLATREREFPAWVARYGADREWDFTAASIDALEKIIVGVAPEELAENPDYAELVDGAIWYYGESYLRARGQSFAWTYDREVSRDCYLQCPQSFDVTQPIYEFETVYRCYEAGALRQRLEN